MTLAQTFGRLRQESAERRGVRFERVYDYTPDELWAALTEQALELMLAGKSHDWDARFSELLPVYADRAEELPADPELAELSVRGMRYQRVLSASLEEVWSALADGNRFRVWMGAEEAVVEPEVGGRVRLVWSDREQMDGLVRVWDPPHVLEYSWHEHTDDSVVRFELELADGGTRLVLDHTRVPESALIGMSAGWHAHLEWLAAFVAGDDEFDFWPRYRELGPVYEDALERIAPSQGPSSRSS